jgi:hypothetical protein
MNKTIELIFRKRLKKGYLWWSLALILGTLIIIFYFYSNMG